VRYTLGKRYVESGDRKWWEYLVLDTFTEMVFGDAKVICACSEEKDAQAICDALNAPTSSAP
jgi:ribosomal silencing factor RsfS